MPVYQVNFSTEDGEVMSSVITAEKSSWAAMQFAMQAFVNNNAGDFERCAAISAKGCSLKAHVMTKLGNVVRYIWTILLLLPAACALSPGQLDTILTKMGETGCVNLVVYGNPLAGASSATLTVPLGPKPLLGDMAATDTTPTVPTMTQTCTVTARHEHVGNESP